VNGTVFDAIVDSIARDRLAFLATFLADFYNVDLLAGNRVSDEVVRFSWNVAAGASAKGTADCVPAWLTDFRPDLARIDVPTLVVHGDADRIVPLAASGARTGALVRRSRTIVIEGGPHGLTWTHADQVNRELVAFLDGGAAQV
jgi:non-heme chloroperoxidase